MTPGRAYWIGVAAMFLILLALAWLPAILGIPLIVVGLWAVGQVVDGRWVDTTIGRWLRNVTDPPEVESW